MTREAIIAENPIGRVLESRGVKLLKSSGKTICRCPLHEDKNPSCSVDLEKGLWNCHAGCGGGSVIDLMAKLDGISVADVLRRYADAEEPQTRTVTSQAPGKIIEALFSYTDDIGREIYQAVRYKPKGFAQRRKVGGSWVWNMDGIERVLYRLPEVKCAGEIWVTEGEKDVESLVDLGYCATCNVGGAGKWLDAYTETLRDKEIILCGDNDAPGRKHIEKILESCAAQVKNSRQIVIPQPFKDVSDYIASFDDWQEAKKALDALKASAQVFTKGVHVPVFSLADLEAGYIAYAQNLGSAQLDLGKWLPSLWPLRGIVPGEFITLIADTGIGKTALLQNIAIKAEPLVTLFFELELPPEMMFERLIATKTGFCCSEVEKGYRAGDTLGKDALELTRHLFVCTEGKITSEKLETIINRAELRIGQRPQLVLLDYLQLMGGKGSSRYERMSTIAEEIKVIAKSTRTIIIAASQIHRKQGTDGAEIFLHDAKDSGSIENSSSLVLGVWRDEDDASLIKLKVLKNGKGRSGLVVDCNFDGETMRITERARATYASAGD